MIVLLDTSVWVEFFRRRPRVNPHMVTLLIEDRRVATCLPVRAEVFSGVATPEARRTVAWAFDAVPTIDPDWNSAATWEKVALLAEVANRYRLGLPGLVDRMILLAARESRAYLWTLERKLAALAPMAGVPIFRPEAP